MKNKNTPLLQAVEDYIAKDYSRLHMPGHKGCPLPLFGDILSFDVTELEGTDSLYHPTDAILHTEQAYTALYGTQASVLSAGGSTLCIQTMLALVAREGGTVLASRNLHSSAVNAMALLNLQPIWLFPARSKEEAFIGTVTPQTVEQTLTANPDALAVYITSPDYFGVMSDIAGISACCKRFGVPLLVDNAHGAHLKFLGEHACHPMDLGADLCCDSLHKTLPTLTGAALLHINNAAFLAQAKACMSLFGSTSPNYLIMLSADSLLRELCGSFPQQLTQTIAKVQMLRQAAGAKGFALPPNCEPLRLSLGLSGCSISGKSFEKHLISHKIQAEFVSDSGCVLLFSPLNRERDFRRVAKAIGTAPVLPCCSTPFPVLYAHPKMTLRQALLAPKEQVDILASVGRISAEVKAPCPPGIPLVMPGEEIAAGQEQILHNYGILTISVVK